MKRNLPSGFWIFIVFIFMWVFYPTIEGFVYQKDPLLAQIQQQVSILDPKFKNIELYEGNKSYTLNKKHVYICLKDENGRYYNRNMLVYVVLHELAHTLSHDVGHTKTFFENFQNLLERATKAGIYNPSIPPLKKYCGVVE